MERLGSDDAAPFPAYLLMMGRSSIIVHSRYLADGGNEITQAERTPEGEASAFDPPRTEEWDHDHGFVPHDDEREFRGRLREGQERIGSAGMPPDITDNEVQISLAGLRHRRIDVTDGQHLVTLHPEHLGHDGAKRLVVLDDDGGTLTRHLPRRPDQRGSTSANTPG